MKRLFAVCCVALFAVQANAQSVTMPAEVKAPVWRFARVVVSFDGDDFKVTGPPQVDVFREYDPNPAVVRLILQGAEEGEFEVKAITTKDKKLSEWGVTKFIVGSGKVVPIPPVPPVPPAPIVTPPIKVDGLTMLIVYDKKLADYLAPDQREVLYNIAFRSVYDSNLKAWRIWDVSESPENTKNAPQPLRDALARARGPYPWVGLYDRDNFFEGLLPANRQAMADLINKTKSK